MAENCRILRVVPSVARFPRGNSEQVHAADRIPELVEGSRTSPQMRDDNLARVQLTVWSNVLYQRREDEAPHTTANTHSRHLVKVEDRRASASLKRDGFNLRRRQRCLRGHRSASRAECAAAAARRQAITASPVPTALATREAARG